MDREPKQQSFFVHSPSLRLSGPKLCSADMEIADVNVLPQLLAPSGLEMSENVFVVAYPSNLVSQDRLPSNPRCNDVCHLSLYSQLFELFSVDVYVVPLEKPSEKLSINAIRSRLQEHYGREKVERIDCLSALRKHDEADIERKSFVLESSMAVVR